jgi:porin
MKLALLAAAAASWSSAGAAQTAPFDAASQTGGGAPVLPPKPPSAALPLDSVKQVPLFGDWGPRKRLAEQGVTFNGRYVLEPAANTRGYRGTGLSVVQHVDVGAVFDFGKLGIVDNGTLRIVVTDRIGNGLNSTKTGSYIQNQAFSGQGKNVRFNELSYEQTFLDARLSVKGGFYAMGNDFGKLPYTCNFTNNGNCGHPLGPVYGSGWRDDPTGQWGARLKWTDRSGWYAQAGVYDVNTLRNKPGHGFDLFSFDQTIGAFIPVEVGYNYGKTPSDYAGTVRIGAYYDTSRASVQGRPNTTTTGRSGVLLQAAQQVWKPHPDTLRGISVFGVATLADRKTGLFRTYFEAGASWRGLFASRPNDILSLSWTEANINSQVAAAESAAGSEVQTREQMLELNYGIQVAPWLLIRPDIQYVIRPGGYRSRPDTIVFGGHIQATL